MKNRITEIEQNLIAAAHGCLTSEEIRFNAEWLFGEVERLHKILHDLTPGGSEFYHDADRCAENIREQIDISRRVAKQTIRNSRSGWKPIERAPKDGRKLIGVTKDGEADNILPDNDRWVSSEDPSYQVYATHYIEPPITEQNP